MRHKPNYVAWCAALTLFGASASQAAGTFFPAPDRVDAIADGNTRILYISETSGVISRFDLETGKRLTEIPINGRPHGIALSPDGSLLVSADSSPSNDYNRVHVIDTQTTAIEEIYMPRAFGESGTFMPAFRDDDTILISSSYSGSGWVPLRQLDLNTGVPEKLRNVRQNTMLASSPNGVVAYAESNSSAGPFGYFPTDYPHPAESKTDWFAYEIGISRDGRQIAVPSYKGMFIFDHDFILLNTMGEYAKSSPIGVAYSPNSDMIYTAWWGTQDSIQVHDAETFEPIKVIDTGLNFASSGGHAFKHGRLRISADGTLLTVTTDGGVKVYEIGDTQPPPCPAEPDSDADGEFDVTDRCPNTSMGEAIDDSGCSRQQFCQAHAATLRLKAPLTPSSYSQISAYHRSCMMLDWRNDQPTRTMTYDCRTRVQYTGKELTLSCQ